MNRCNWVNDDKLYKDYHDNEWGIPSKDDNYLFEMLVLEVFHTGLSFYTVLKKRENFRKAFNKFNYKVISKYNDEDITRLLENKDIIRHKGKILATINNADIYLNIIKEYGSFSNYIWSFTDNKVIKELDITKSELSDIVTKDMKSKGFKHIGSVTIYSYLQAIGIINSHQKECFLYK